MGIDREPAPGREDAAGVLADAGAPQQEGEVEEPQEEPDALADQPVEDFTDEEPGPAPAAPSTPPYNPEPERERMRGLLAAGLTAVFAIVVLGSPLTLAFGVSVDELKSVLEVILPPIVALTGTAIGFYFGGGRGS